MAKSKPKSKKKVQKSTKDKSQHLGKLLATGELNEILGRGKATQWFRQVDASSLIFFRIFFGLIMLWEMLRYLSKGWISEMFTRPAYNFNYWPFEFLSPLPGSGMTILFIGMAILSICIMTGLFYRVATVAFFLSFSYMFLLEQTRYLNHFYLVVLLSFVMIFLPLNRSASLDVRWRKQKGSETVPLWALWFAKLMVAVPYFFGGIAKITPDWLQGEPLQGWLQRSVASGKLGSFFEMPIVAYGMSYGGLLLDLLVVPALLFKRTRTIAFLLLLGFHLMNATIFNIGIFPWFMIVASTLYFSPSWPRKLLQNLGGKWPMRYPSREALLAPATLNSRHRLILGGIAVWMLIQVAVPLRFLFFPGNVNWTEEGHRFSWHMKLREKKGRINFIVKDKDSGMTQIVDPRTMILPWQYRKMSIHPYLIWQFADHLKDQFAAQGQDVAVFADSKASLNGRAYQQLIDPGVDLTSVARPVFGSSPWITPLSTPLSEKDEPRRRPPQ